jgi:chemotaxis family two-component system response regulator Rcp1
MPWEYSARACSILLVEDNPADVRLMQEGLATSAVGHHLSVVDNGVEALAFLRQEMPYAQAPRPHLILLDLHLPKKHGLEVLVEIKADPQLRQIPVIILTSSHARQDIEAAYALHTNCYITKPTDWEQLTQVVRIIEAFWCTVATVP